MSKIMELRTKRNTLWEQTKAFLEKHRGENGLVEASAVEQYNKMAGEVQALGAEIERLEQQAAVDAALSVPTSKPVNNAPKSQNKAESEPTASAEYSNAFWNMIRNKGDQFAVRNALSVGEDTEGGYTVPFAYHHFAEGESPKPPFLIFLSPGENTFGADNLMYHSFKKLDIELYTDEKSPETEERVEEVLLRHNLYYTKTEVWIESERLYEVLYEMEV